MGVSVALSVFWQASAASLPNEDRQYSPNARPDASRGHISAKLINVSIGRKRISPVFCVPVVRNRKGYLPSYVVFFVPTESYTVGANPSFFIYMFTYLSPPSFCVPISGKARIC